MKTAIVTDSTAYIPKDIREKLRIHMIPLSVVFGNESYQEEVEISIDDFYEKIRHSKGSPEDDPAFDGDVYGVVRKTGQGL